MLKKKIKLEYTPTQQNIADLMTKQFTKQKINTFKNMLFGIFVKW